MQSTAFDYHYQIVGSKLDLGRDLLVPVDETAGVAPLLLDVEGVIRFDRGSQMRAKAVP